MDKAIVMERLNAPTKDTVYTSNIKAGAAIRDAITRYFAKYLQDNGQTNLSSIDMQLYIFLQDVKSDMNKFVRAQLSARINFRQNNGIISPSVQLNCVPNKALLI